VPVNSLSERYAPMSSSNCGGGAVLGGSPATRRLMRSFASFLSCLFLTRPSTCSFGTVVGAAFSATIDFSEEGKSQSGCGPAGGGFLFPSFCIFGLPNIANKSINPSDMVLVAETVDTNFYLHQRKKVRRHAGATNRTGTRQK